MDTIKDRNMVVFYYKDLPDLLTQKEEFEKLQIGLSFFGKDNPVRLCPRGSDLEDMWYILLWNSGDKEKDKKLLDEALGRLGMNFYGEL